MSTKTTYAIRALIDLAQRDRANAQKISDIAKTANVPVPFLEQIFFRLKKAGIVQSMRGPQGGILLLKSPEEITLADIVTALEGPLDPVLCSMPENRSHNCHDVEGCSSRVICYELDGAIYHVLAKHSIASLAKFGEHTTDKTVNK